MIKKMLLALAMTILVSQIIGAPILRQDAAIREWYAVEDWELDVCSMWGGTAEASKTSGTVGAGETRLSQVAVTVQGYKTRTGNGTVYEIGYYLAPMVGRLEFTILLDGQHKRTLVDWGSASSEAGFSDYYAEYLADEYDYAIMNYTIGILKVPLVERMI